MTDTTNNEPQRTWRQWLCRPRVMMVLSGIFLLILSPFVYRAWRLSLVINIQAFDRQRVIAEEKAIPLVDNAASDFQAGISKLKRLAAFELDTFEEAASLSRSDISEPYLSWLNDNELAIIDWEQGALKKHFSEYDLETLSYNTMAIFPSECRDFTRLLLLKAKREVGVGNLKEAINTHLHSFRSSLLIGKQGTMISKLMSIASLNMTLQQGIVPLISDPRVDEATLREFQSKLLVDYQQLTIPFSRVIQIETIFFENSVRESTATELLAEHCDLPTGGAPDVFLNTGLYFAAEPNLTMRVHHQVIANLLTHCDQPRYLRPTFPGKNVDLYVTTSTTSSPGMMMPNQIEEVIDRSLFERLAPAFTPHQLAVDQFEAKWAAINTAFLVEIHRRRHGTYPMTLADLDLDLKKELPIDPFTGKVLIFKTNTSASPLIYCVGDNLSDDGGNFEDHLDCGFQLGVPSTKSVPAEE